MIKKVVFLSLLSVMLSLVGCNQSDEKKNLATGGFIGNKDMGFAIIDYPFYAGKKDKYLWNFWKNDGHMPYGELKVIATKNENNESVQMNLGKVGGSGYKDVDAFLPTTMSFPSVGTWKLDVYLDGKLLGDVSIVVKEPPVE